MKKRRKGIFGPELGKKCVIFVDDLNMPKKETYGHNLIIKIIKYWKKKLFYKIFISFFYIYRCLTSFRIIKIILWSQSILLFKLFFYFF